MSGASAPTSKDDGTPEIRGASELGEDVGDKLAGEEGADGGGLSRIEEAEDIMDDFRWERGIC